MPPGRRCAVRKLTSGEVERYLLERSFPVGAYGALHLMCLIVAFT